ncbi:MAG TPA: histidine phosphotransferase family protein [Alphaproteobacteria bacterium]|nr:histidine phosphotransferase family protein [Alphaproteobacteria bacterium]
MTERLELHAVEMLCSRLCHDLVGPVSAISNGVELVEEMGGYQEGDEAWQLIADSAARAGKRLACLRLAYGTAGERGLGGSAVAQAMAGWLEGGNVAVDWGNSMFDAGDHQGLLRVMLNVVLLAVECLPRGGRVALSAAGPEITIVASGQTTLIAEGTAEALAGRVAAAELSPRSIHPYITGCFARRAGFGVTVEGGQGAVTFRVSKG